MHRALVGDLEQPAPLLTVQRSREFQRALGGRPFRFWFRNPGSLRRGSSRVTDIWGNIRKLPPMMIKIAMNG
jgi:hypothetical protein